MKKYLYIVLVASLVMITLKFFDAQFLDASLLNYLLFLTLILIVAISFPFFIREQKGFVFPVQLLTVAMLISMITAGVYWDQGILNSLIATAPYLIFLFFFFLLKIEFPIEIMERVIVTYGVLYLGLYAFEFLNSPKVYFGKPLWGDEFLESRGIIRIIFPGGGVFVLTSFIAINKITSETKYKWFWYLLATAGIVVPVLQVTRQFIAGIALIYFFHILKTFGLKKKLLIFSIVFVLTIILLNNSEIPVLKGLIESTQRDVELGSKYIRVLAGEFFIADFSPNWITQVFGNGVPYFGVSNYGYYVDMLGVTQEFFLSDVGIIAVYVMFGLPAILAYILIWWKSFVIPLPSEYQYLKYYLWFMLFTSLTWYTTYHYHYLITTVYTLYIYQNLYLKRIEANKSQKVVPKLRVSEKIVQYE